MSYFEHLPKEVHSVELKEPEGLVLINSCTCPNIKRSCSKKMKDGLCCLGKESSCTRNNCPNKLVG